MDQPPPVTPPTRPGKQLEQNDIDEDKAAPTASTNAEESVAAAASHVTVHNSRALANLLSRGVESQRRTDASDPRGTSFAADTNSSRAKIGEGRVLVANPRLLAFLIDNVRTESTAAARTASPPPPVPHPAIDGSAGRTSDTDATEKAPPASAPAAGAPSPPQPVSASRMASRIRATQELDRN
jgi:hypothetical protein